MLLVAIPPAPRGLSTCLQIRINMCVCSLGPSTAQSHPTTWVGLMAPTHQEARCIFYQRWFPSDEWLSHEHNIVDCFYKQFISHVLLIPLPRLMHGRLLPPLIKASAVRGGLLLHPSQTGGSRTALCHVLSVPYGYLFFNLRHVTREYRCLPELQGLGRHSSEQTVQGTSLASRLVPHSGTVWMRSAPSPN